MLKFLLIFFLFTSCHGEIFSFHDKIQSIPPQQLDRIARLFNYLLHEEPFAYTLLGDKPLSITGWQNRYSEREFKNIPYVAILESDWKIWNKWSPLFLGKNFIFKAVKLEDGYFEIQLINKPAFLNIIRNNLPLFQKHLNCKESADKIFNNITSADDLFEVGLAKSQHLYGLLLGFGSTSSGFFHCYHNLHLPIKGDLFDFGEDITLLPLIQFPIPQFAAFEMNDEVRGLIEKYTQQQQAISEIYTDVDSCEKTLFFLSE